MLLLSKETLTGQMNWVAISITKTAANTDKMIFVNLLNFFKLLTVPFVNHVSITITIYFTIFVTKKLYFSQISNTNSKLGIKKLLSELIVPKGVFVILSFILVYLSSLK